MAEYRGRWSEENTRLKKLLREFILRHKRNNPGKPINTKTLGDKIGELWELDIKKGQYQSHKLSNLRRNSPQLFEGIRIVEAPHASFNLNTWSSHEGVRNSLKSFIDSFKKNNPGQPMKVKLLHDKVKEIWKLNESGAHKLSSLREYNPEIFSGLKIISSKESAPMNKLYQEDAKFREFFKKNYPNRKWENLTAESGFMGKSLKNTTYRNYLTSLKREKVIPKNYIGHIEFAKEMGLNYKTLTSARSSNNFNNKIVKDLFKPKFFNREVYYEAPTKETKAKYKELYSEGIIESRKGMVAKKQAGFTEPIKALYKELLIDPDASPRELAEAIYGDSKARTLQYIGNDASKLTEVLTGSRNLPGFRAPSPLITKAILANILSPGNGWFNYGNFERRRAMMRERDQILKTKGDKLSQLRFKLRAPGKHLDEVMSLAATYKRAPGYTELAQSIAPEVNMLKGNTIDREFSLLFEKVITGKEGVGTFRGTKYNNLKEHINLFNKASGDFQKAHGVDTAIIEYQPNKKLLAKDFVKNFKYLSPEAAVNVQELADKGIALKSNAMPMGRMVEMLVNAVKKSPAGCRNLIAAQVGGSIATCVEVIKRDPVGSANKLNEIKPTSAALGKVRNAARSFLQFVGKGKYFAATAGVGAGVSALVKQFVSDDPSTYLSNDKQANAMILDTLDQREREERQEAIGDAPELLDEAYIGAEVAATAAAIPGSGALYKARKGKGYGPARAALGPVGKAVSGFATPLGMAALTPLSVASQLYEGKSAEDIATNPLNYLGPAFAGTLTKEATRGMASTGMLSNALRLGMKPNTIKAISSRFGLPGLALSLGYTGYDQYKKYGEGRGFVYDLFNK